MTQLNQQEEVLAVVDTLMAEETSAVEMVEVAMAAEDLPVVQMEEVNVWVGRFSFLKV